MLLDRILSREAQKTVKDFNDGILEICVSDFHTPEIVKIEVIKNLSGEGKIILVTFKTKLENFLKKREKIEEMLQKLKEGNSDIEGSIREEATIFKTKQKKSILNRNRKKLPEAKKVLLNKLQKIKISGEENYYIYFEVFYYYSVLKSLAISHES